MNDWTWKIAVLIPIAFFQAAASGSSPQSSEDCLQVTIASNGTITVRFALPEKLAAPPWDLDALADYGFSLEKHGSLPYFPVRPVAFGIRSKAVSMKVLKSKVADAADAIRQASATRQPSIESEILSAPKSGRPIPLVFYPESSFPSHHVIAPPEGGVTFGKRTVARVKIYPFARQEGQSATTRADLLVFSIAPQRLALAEEAVLKPAKSAARGKTEASRPLILNVPSEGIYAVPSEDLFSWWGEDPLPLSSLGFKCRGQDIAYQATGDGDELLEADESILFYGLGGDNIFTPDNAYWLMKDDQAVVMQSVSRPPPAEGSVTHLPRVVRFEHNRLLYEAHPPGMGEDHWFWEKVTSPGKAEVEIELSNLADSADFQAEIRVGVQGATASHNTGVSINGNTLAEELWNGLVSKVFKGELRQELLREGTNLLTVEELSEDENPDIVYLDWIEVRYDSRLVFEDGQLRVTVPANTAGIIVSGLEDGDVLVFDVTEERRPYFVEGFSTAPANGTYQVGLGTMSDSERRYVILSSGSVKHPSSIRQRSESRWSERENGADWIAITSSDFVEAARGLASHRESQGYRTAVVDVQDIYDEFNYGVTSPVAVQTFVRFAYENWEAPAPKYLLLLGDGHADYMDWVGGHQPNFILPHCSWVPPLGWAPDDDWFGCVEGDDAFAEVFVGRVPVRSAAEAEAAVEKIMSYDSIAVPQEWQRRITFCGSAGSLFQTICWSIADASPPNFERSYLFRDDFPDAESLKEELLESLEVGTLLLFYVGHGNVERWSEYILQVSDVPSLTNAGKLPIMCMLTCLSGYFAVPWKECLAEELVRSPTGGAAGCIAPTGTGYPSEHWVLGQEIARQFFAGATLGECLAEAKINSYARGLSETCLRGFGLIGDSATVPRLVPAAPDLIWFY